MKIKDFIIELRCIKNDLEDIREQIGATLRDVDMVLGDYYDPTNVDTDPPDEYNVYDDKDGHSCNTTADGG